MSEHHSIKWENVLNSLPTECSRNHQTVEMINYIRSNQGSNDRQAQMMLKFFCPSCRQKIAVGARKIGDTRYAATSVNIIEEGGLP